MIVANVMLAVSLRGQGGDALGTKRGQSWRILSPTVRTLFPQVRELTYSSIRRFEGINRALGTTSRIRRASSLREIVY